MTHNLRLGFDFDMLVFNIKQVNLVCILRSMKPNLKHATPIQKKNKLIIC